MRRSPAPPSRFAVSPVKSKRKDGQVNAPRLEDDLRLTPKKQKTVPVSPTKSILKNSHAPTPRRAGLRDVTVTFKDLRKSMSPELSRGSPVRVRSQPEMGRALQSLAQDAAPSKLVSKVEISAVAAPSADQPARTSVPRTAGHPDFDLEAYKAQTEKEMRRLIKYGQKWKEQARRHDEENEKLRSLLDETQKENERLQKKITQIREAQDEPLKQKSALEAKAEEVYNAEPRRQHATATNESSRPKAPTRQLSLQQKLDELQQLQPSPPNASVSEQKQTKPKEPQPRQPSLQKKINLLKGTSSEKERIMLHEAQAQRENDTRQPADLLPDDQDADADQEVQRMSLPLRTASVSAAEDRKAAARERLRLKREARAASSQAVFDVVKKKQQKGAPESSRLQTDESQVDWMAMA